MDAMRMMARTGAPTRSCARPRRRTESLPRIVEVIAKTCCRSPLASSEILGGYVRARCPSTVLCPHPRGRDRFRATKYGLDAAGTRGYDRHPVSHDIHTTQRCRCACTSEFRSVLLASNGRARLSRPMSADRHGLVISAAPKPGQMEDRPMLIGVASPLFNQSRPTARSRRSG